VITFEAWTSSHPSLAVTPPPAPDSSSVFICRRQEKNKRNPFCEQGDLMSLWKNAQHASQPILVQIDTIL
jgi:hypothetical protein